MWFTEIEETHTSLSVARSSARRAQPVVGHRGRRGARHGGAATAVIDVPWPSRPGCASGRATSRCGRSPTSSASRRRRRPRSPTTRSASREEWESSRQLDAAACRSRRPGPGLARLPGWRVNYDKRAGRARRARRWRRTDRGRRTGHSATADRCDPRRAVRVVERRRVTVREARSRGRDTRRGTGRRRDGVPGADRVEDLERVLRARDLGVDDGLRDDARAALRRSCAPRATGTRVSWSPWITKNGGRRACTRLDRRACLEALAAASASVVFITSARAAASGRRAAALAVAVDEVVDAVERDAPRTEVSASSKPGWYSRLVRGERRPAR